MTATQSATSVQITTASNADALIKGTFETFIILVGVVCILLWLSEKKPFTKLFKAIPLVIWVVLIPATMVGVGVIPRGLDLYINIGQLCLPLSLFYLIVSCDLSGINKLGKQAIISALAGTTGIAIGGTIVVLLFAVGDNAHLWQGFAVISAGWIGGTANGVAVQQGLQAPASVIAPLILMQTLMGFVWLIGILSLAPHQDRITALLRGTTSTKPDIAVEEEANTSSLSLGTFAGLIALGFLSLILSGAIGSALPELGEPTIVSKATWVILIISAIGIVVSYKGKRFVPSEHTSNLGYLFLYMMLASLGTQLDFSAFDQIGTYVAAGAIWLLVHLIILTVAGRLFKLPVSMLALGSMSNVGGIVTTPLVASYYDKKLVPLALLMAVGTQIIGVYLPFALATLFSGIALP